MFEQCFNTLLCGPPTQRQRSRCTLQTTNKIFEARSARQDRLFSAHTAHHGLPFLTSHHTLGGPPAHLLKCYSSATTRCLMRAPVPPCTAPALSLCARSPPLCGLRALPPSRLTSLRAAAPLAPLCAALQTAALRGCAVCYSLHMRLPLSAASTRLCAQAPRLCAGGGGGGTSSQSVGVVGCGRGPPAVVRVVGVFGRPAACCLLVSLVGSKRKYKK